MKPGYIQKFILFPIALILVAAAGYEWVQAGPGAKGERITNLIPALQSAIENEEWERAERIATEIERLWGDVQPYVVFNNRRMDTDAFDRALAQARAGIKVKDPPTALSNAHLMERIWAELDEF